MSFRLPILGVRAIVLVMAVAWTIAVGAASAAAEVELAGEDLVSADLLDALGIASSESFDETSCQRVPTAPAAGTLSVPTDDTTNDDLADTNSGPAPPPEAIEDGELLGESLSVGDCDDPHQVWLISSRAIGACDDPAASVSRIRHWHYRQGQGWVTASPEQFAASDDPAIPTVFYVHGHRIDQGYAKAGGWDAYRAIVRPTAVPTRFVIYSWPTTPHGHPMREFRIRACESEVHGYYLAWVIDRIHPEVPIHLVGFSYGSRLITSTLHYLGGGAIGRRSLADRVFPARHPLRASLIAAALDNDWLLPGRRHGQALTQVDRMFVTKNPVDPVLHWYPVVLRDRGAVPLGVTGVAGLSRLGEERVKIEQLNVSQAIGKRHAIALYWDVDQVVGIIRGMVDDIEPAEGSNEAAD